jgi:hypothetical protein
LEITFHLTLPGEPPAQIDLRRLEGFARTLRSATFRSAQGILDVPAYRSHLAGRKRPGLRLSGLTDGSVGLQVTTIEADPDGLAVQVLERHVESLALYQSEGRWPGYVTAAERQAWSEVYRAVFRGDRDARATVELEGHAAVSGPSPKGELA